MSIEIIVVGLVVAFIIGNFMGLKPKPHETRLGNLRLSARQMGLYPKFIDTTQIKWLDEPAIQYTLIDDNWRLPYIRCVAKDGVWHTQDTHPLDGQAILLPDRLLPYIKGLALRSNSISLYWQDDVYIKSFGIRQETDTIIKQDLQSLCEYLRHIASH